MHLEGGHVSLQQRPDQSGGFQAAGWHESERKQPLGQEAQTIPWLEIEKRYAALFTNRKGNVAKPLRLALGACIIQAEYGYSDEETALQIQENPYLQYFCGYPGYDDEKLPFDPSLMVYFRKRLTPEVLGEINEMISAGCKSASIKRESKTRMTITLMMDLELVETAAL